MEQTNSQILEQFCRTGIRAAASDIHIKAGQKPHYRVNGTLMPIPQTTPISPEQSAQMAWDIMNTYQRSRFKADKDVDFSWFIASVGRFRVNVFRQRAQVGIVLRAIPTHVKTIDELGLPAVCKKIASEQRGLILVTGATGSGKSTTLAAIVEEINRTQQCHILTIEDPVEFAFRDKKAIINQREVGVDTDSFPQALRAALRQDPDVILVGELRDLDSMEIALAAAETGHLVLSTVHSLDAPETINRIIGFFEPHHQAQVRLQLGATLKSVISQRLVPKRGGGRLAALEIMLNTGSVYECIVDPSRTREIPDLIAAGHDQYGSQTFDQAIYDFYSQQQITLGDALRFSNNPDNLTLKVHGIGTDI